jgi:hypothetical protein
LRPVDQRNGFFRFQYQRLDLCSFQRVTAGNARAGRVDALPFTDERQRQMRQGSQIATRAHTSLRRHERSDATVQHLAQCVDDNSAHARVSLGQRISAQQHHGAGFRDGERFAHARGVRADQVDLQLANLVANNANVAELAHTGRDRIGQLVAGNDLVDHGPRPVDSLARIG